MRYTLNLDCPVKWTATQEKMLSNELPSTEISRISASTRVLHVYHQALWLPESIMSLDRLVPSLSTTLVAASTSSIAQFDSRSLSELFRPHLMTPRQVTEKYHKRIAALVEQQDNPEIDPNDELMWYVMRYQKDLPEDADTPEEQQTVYQAWKSAWLSRMEQREIMVQLLLHFLLLSLFDIVEDEPKPDPTTIATNSSSPRKRKYASPQDDLSVAALEERLELLMDRLAMWQLMYSVDLNAGGDAGVRQVHRLTSLHKGEQKSTDDRDWMQIFCEDIVEPTFRSKLPTQCSLLRSKVFQTSPFDDEDSLDLPDTPPASPPPNSKPLKNSAHRADVSSKEQQPPSRNRSLSTTLEEERARERSRSLSVGPNNIQKRAIAREVSMSTAFRGKEKKKKTQGLLSRPVALGRTKSITESVAKPKGKDHVGTTLVAATPVKVKSKAGRPFSSAFPADRDVLPTILDHPDISHRNPAGRAVEGGDDDDDWMPHSSPDVLLLTDEDRSTSPDANALGDSLGTRPVFEKRRTLVESTPTKRRRK